MKARKIYIVPDTKGHILHVTVHTANRYNTVDECEFFEKAVKKYLSLENICAEIGYRKTVEMFVINVLKITIEIYQRITKKWSILTKKSVVEITFSWLNHFRRLSNYYEITTSSAKNYVIIFHSIGLLQRLMKV